VIGKLIGFLVAAGGASALLTHALSRRIEARYPPVGDLVEVDGGYVHVVETKPAAHERGSVVLVHGASGNFADLHVALAEPLAALGFRVFSVDRPGHGWSTRLGRGTDVSSPERQAEWLRQALAKRGVAEAIVVAHSLAGVLGLAMALNAPRFTRGLVLLAPVSHPWPGGVSWYYNLAAAPLFGSLFRWLIVPTAARLYMPGGLAEVFAPNPTPPEYIERTRLPLMLRPRHFRANAEDVVAIAGHVARLSKLYRGIRSPTAIVTGDRDSVVYAHIHSQGCAAEIPGATLRVLKDVGHSPHYGAPDVVIETILDVERRARGPERASEPLGAGFSRA
jgi:pimeloyl-ACP methyl ester carboxylesterase